MTHIDKVFSDIALQCEEFSLEQNIKHNELMNQSCNNSLVKSPKIKDCHTAN